jgi:hypothetical protein
LVKRLLLCSLPQFFIDNLVRPADLKNLPDAGVDEDMDFLYGVQGLMGVVNVDDHLCQVANGAIRLGLVLHNKMYTKPLSSNLLSTFSIQA